MAPRKEPGTLATMRVTGRLLTATEMAPGGTQPPCKTAVSGAQGTSRGSTRFIEASGIDVPAISEQAKSTSDYRRRLDRAMNQAFQDNPSLVAYGIH
jgi:hypothetical protein